MLVNERTIRALEYRRTVDRWLKEGFEEVGESGGKLWEIYRGWRVGKIIKAVRIAPDGMSIFVKIGPP